MLGLMAVGGRRADIGRDEAHRLVLRLGGELREARRGAGVSLSTAAAAAGMDASSFARLERGVFRGASVEKLALAFAAVGMKLSARAYPDGDAVRDAGHLRLLMRLRQRLPSWAPWGTEVPLPIPGDRRAVDARTQLAGTAIDFEAETRIGDVQALLRRLALKIRDSPAQITILVVADTAHNRHVLGAYRETLRELLPLDSRAILAAFAQAKAPARNGIVVV